MRSLQSATPYRPALARRVALAALLASPASCTQVAPGLPHAPRPVLPAQAEALPPYRVQVGDVLSLRLYLSPELDEDVTVRPDGRIGTTLVQAIPAYGRTPEQIAELLLPAYEAELRNPKLTVTVKAASPERIYVAGEVTAAGEFSTSYPGLTLVQAIARAGGLRIAGDADHVFILRRGPDDRPVVFAADYAAAMRGDDPAADVRLAPFDVVYVPKTGINRLYVWVNQHIQQFVPVTWGFSYNVNPLVTAPR